MALNVDLDPGDILVVPPDSGAKIRIREKSGRRTSLSIESAEPVKVLRARDQQAASTEIPKPSPRSSAPSGRPK